MVFFLTKKENDTHKSAQIVAMVRLDEKLCILLDNKATVLEPRGSLRIFIDA